MNNEESERITTSQDVISRLHDKIDEQHARIVELEAQLAAAQQAVQAAVPDGWQMVPAKPTEAMVGAIMSEGEVDAVAGLAPELRPILLERAGIAARYTAMLAAAPTHPAEGVPAQAAATQPAAQGMDMVNCKSGNWLTVVYRDIRPGDEARTIGEHPKVSALSWSHALNDRDAALAAQAKQGDQQ